MSGYPDAVRFLYSLGNEVKSLKFGLEAIQALLEELRNPHTRFASVHVAGTNGKGSTSAMLESMLRAEGKQTGLFTSPHLIEPTERIQVNGAPISKDEFTEAFRRVHEASERLISNGTLDSHPTYFETATAMAFDVFAASNVEMAVVEVGMGGRLDATNVLHPRLSVITPIDLDHQQWLGETIGEIAVEKAGILKRGVPLVVANQKPAADAVISETASLLNVPVTRAAGVVVSDAKEERWSSRFYADGLHICCPLAGRHQIQNTQTAIAAAYQLGIGQSAIAEGVRNVRWPGRLERVCRNPDVLLDGAHNVAGALSLVEYLSQQHAGRKIWMIFGAMRDKAVAEVAQLLFPLAAGVFATAPRSIRAMSGDEIRSVSPSQDKVQPFPVFADAYRAASEAATPDDLILITGSLYLVGEARAHLVQ